MAVNDLRLGAIGAEILLTPFARRFKSGWIELARTERTASGRFVKDIRARKRKWSIEYDYITQADLEAIETVYAYESELGFIVTLPDTSTESFTVLMGPFDKDRAKAVDGGYWSGVTLEIEEV